MTHEEFGMLFMKNDKIRIGNDIFLSRLTFQNFQFSSRGASLFLIFLCLNQLSTYEREEASHVLNSILNKSTDDALRVNKIESSSRIIELEKGEQLKQATRAQSGLCEMDHILKRMRNFYKVHNTNSMKASLLHSATHEKFPSRINAETIELSFEM